MASWWLACYHSGGCDWSGTAAQCHWEEFRCCNSGGIGCLWEWPSPGTAPMLGWIFYGCQPILQLLWHHRDSVPPGWKKLSMNFNDFWFLSHVLQFTSYNCNLSLLSVESKVIQPFYHKKKTFPRLVTYDAIFILLELVGKVLASWQKT